MRRKELVKITLENQAFLKRLQKKQATYSVERWENEFARQTRYRDQICENPYEFGDGLPRTRLMTAKTTADEYGSMGGMPRQGGS